MSRSATRSGARGRGDVTKSVDQEPSTLRAALPYAALAVVGVLYLWEVASLAGITGQIEQLASVVQSELLRADAHATPPV